MVRTRVAPSPTGFPHVGTIYQAIFDRAVANKSGGQLVVRIEDTDQKRFVAGSEDVIYESLAWAKIMIDESPIIGGNFGPYRQSERLQIYKEYAQKLVSVGGAYFCFCTPERLVEMRRAQEDAHKPTIYDKHCRSLSKDEVKARLEKGEPCVARLKVPEGTMITVKDTIRGDISFQSDLIDDAVLLKSDGFPTYHLALVIDDHLMEITDPIRGEEWISSYPKHKLIYDYFGWIMPVYTHLPLLHNPDGSKVAKRHGHTSINWYKEQGILPEALVNYLTLMVWNHPRGKEIYSFEEFAKHLDLKEVSLAGPRFDLKKLEWLNGEYIRSMGNEEIAKRLCEYLRDYSKNPSLQTFSLSDLLPVIPLIKERMKKLSDFEFLAGFFFQSPWGHPDSYPRHPEPFSRHPEHSEGSNPPDYSFKYLPQLINVLGSLPKPWTKEDWEKSIRKLAEDIGVKAGEVFMDLRVAVTGNKIGPDLFESIKILGEEETLARLNSVQVQFNASH